MNIASNTKRSGRAVRRADRIRHHVNYLPELDRGIPYLDLMTPEQVERIHDASMNILETKGIVFRDDEALDMWRAAGAKVVNETVYLDRAHLMQLISTVPETYRMHARNPERSVTVGARKQIFTPSYGAPNVIDLQGRRVPSTMEHFDNFAKLGHIASSLHMSGGVVCEPLDIPVHHRPINMVTSLVRHSDKPFMGIVTSTEAAKDTMEIAKIVFGADFVQDNCVTTSLINCNTPFIWDSTMLDVAKVYARSNQACLYAPFVLCGANTPAHIYGTIIQINAEALAGIAFSQLCRVGAPAVYGSWVATVSMKSGAPMSGTPDIDHINMMIGQMARYYKIPSRCSGGCNSSKAMDFQAGYESARNMFSAVLGGINFIFSAAGYIETAMSHSYSKFAHDIEQLEQFYAFAKGPNYDGIEAAIDAINDTRPGGHYLGHAHTLENFQTAFCLPTLMHHDSVEQWVEEGSLDANQRGLIRARQLLEEYEKPYLDPAIDEALKDFKTRRLSEIVGEVR